jgi:hypothetical protein
MKSMKNRENDIGSTLVGNADDASYTSNMKVSIMI